MNTIVIFVYSKRNAVCDLNLLFFVKNGIIPRDDIKYFVVINGESDIIDIPGATVIRRENKGGDFGGWWHVLQEYRSDRYILINDTCRGPFTPRYNTAHWVDQFCARLNTFKNGKVIKAVGPTENWDQHQHIQSYCIGIDGEAMEYLIDNGLFATEYDPSTIEGKGAMVAKQEVGMSRMLIENGWEVFCFLLSQMRYPRNMDVTFKPGWYDGITVNPIELMYIKTTWINDAYVQKYSHWMMA